MPTLYRVEEFVEKKAQMWKTLRPRVPHRLAPGEDSTTPRTPAGDSVAACLRLVPQPEADGIYDERIWRVWQADVPDAASVVPTKAQVPDQGTAAGDLEVWVLAPTDWQHVATVVASVGRRPRVLRALWRAGDPVTDAAYIRRLRKMQ